jgi:hypothetical protein
VIAGADEAEGWGMHGSPTLLIDGADPFAGSQQRPGMSCRLYRDEAGRPSGAPSIRQLQQVIEPRRTRSPGCRRRTESR